jgi:hypothetical protein
MQAWHVVCAQQSIGNLTYLKKYVYFVFQEWSRVQIQHFYSLIDQCLPFSLCCSLDASQAQGHWTAIVEVPVGHERYSHPEMLRLQNNQYGDNYLDTYLPW